LFMQFFSILSAGVVAPDLMFLFILEERR